MNPKEPIVHIQASEFAQRYRNSQLNEAVLLDVREEREWKVYHLKEATLIPLSQLPFRMKGLSRDKVLYVYCAHGVRSIYAVQYLWDQGFQHLVHVDGGLAEVSLYLEETDLSTCRKD
ncbi:rhodanese-like domain-containing protein [Kroppenstedtia pulmonis]|uniref:Rhodanese-like domain-containing protein n=1 Tax=Kroppenstedtia pulmonis TaxID=1380685 RepID=A0A7D4CME6_9BACL|nr:rhodanese-like domain-containing protein [Kroppenstedtia pulmonis]QKG84298.1 rhodanese-like domain-containing protein [Kroppenstedtia pulmonis]